MVYNKIYAQLGEERHIVLDPINYQYDIKQILVIQGETVPEYYEADICNVGDTATLTMVGTAADGVEIPDKFLLDGRNVLVYVVIPGSGGDVQTRYDITIPVDERAEREDIDPSEAEQQQIDSLVAALNSGVARTETAAEAAEGSASDAEAAAEAVQNLSVAAETLATGEPATVEKTVDPDTGAVTLRFGLPRGVKGDPLTYEDLTPEQKAELVQGPILEAQDAAVTAVRNARASAVDAVGSAGTTAVGAVSQAGTTQVGAVNQAGATQVQAVEDKGDEVLDSIPQDYTDLVDDVADLTRQLSDETTGLDTKAPVILETASGAIASFDDGADSMPIKSLVAQIEPVQDLHGYDSPWPAGGGANKFGGDALKTALLTVTGATEGSDANGNYVNLPASGALNNVILFSDFEENQQYTIIFKILPTGSHASNIRVYYTDNTAQTFSTSGDGQLETVSYTTAAGKTVESIRLGYWYTSTCKVYYDSCGVFVGADQTFAPYENLCPISGHTGAEIEQTGKNLWDGSVSFVQGTFSRSDDWGSFVSSTTRIRTLPFKFLAGTFTISNTSGFDIVMYFYDLDGTGRVVRTYVEWESSPRTVVIPEDCMIAIGLRKSNDATITPDELTGFQIELGSTTATDYALYTGNQISVTFPETIYGGEDEVISGKLKDTMKKRVLDGSENWAIDTDRGGRKCFYIMMSDLIHKLDFDYLGSIFASNMKTIKVLGGSEAAQVDSIAITGYGYPSTNNYLYILVNPQAAVFENITTVDALKAWLAQNNTEVVYRVEEPTEYTLTPQTMETLYGTNNVWSNTGDITELDYCADTKLYIDGKLAELQATILENIGG